MKCMSCGKTYPLFDKRILCECGGLLQVEMGKLEPPISWEELRRKHFMLWRYRRLIPVPEEARIVSLNEGGTPLIRLKRISEILELRELYGKFEGTNPTGSFKDRGMTVATTMAVFLGFKNVICASTGNTSASMTAYAARAGLNPIVVLPKDKVAKGKVAQTILHGAVIIYVNGGFDEALKVVLEASKQELAYSLNSINPWRIEGQKTIAYEIVDEIDVPDWIIVPVGNAGNISAIWKGLLELKQNELIDRIPRLAGVQAEGASPLVKAFREQRDYIEPVDNPKTIASAIRIGNPVNWKRALKAVRESEGVLIAVNDREIIDAQKELARVEGLGVEPTSAATLAGLRKLVEEKIIDRNERVVLVLTGHALKDPEAVSNHLVHSFTVNSVEEALRMVSALQSTLTH